MPTNAYLCADMHINYVPPAQLKPYERNARTHSKKQVRQIADSIKEFGFTNPVLVDGNQMIIAGHGRVQAAIQLGYEKVPTICLDHLTEAQKRAYIIADNRLAEKAGWDSSILAIELQHLSDLELDFDLTITGFDMPEIDKFIIGDQLPDDSADHDLPSVPEHPVTRLGDLWKLGEHFIYCGNSLERESYAKLLNGKKASMVFTDPPYNVPIQGHVGGRGEIKHAEFAMASGEMSPQQFTAFLKSACHLMAEFSTDGSMHFIAMDWAHIYELLTAGKGVYSELKNICIWNKDRGGMGGLYRSKHEMVALFKNGTGKHINNIELGKHGRNRTNVWDYPAVNTLRKGGKSELAMHPTVKPVRMVADAIQDCSNRGDVVLDPFGGSGSTLLAADKTGRRGYLVELEPKYVDVSITRWQKAVKAKAVHVETGQTFEELKVEREGQI